jgi:PilZ domain
MSFSIRPYRRFPVCHPVTYHAGLSEGSGTVWNISLSGWRLSGDLPMCVGQTCSLFVNLSNRKRDFVVAGIVRWVRGEEYGIETLVANRTTQAHIVHYFRQRARESVQPPHERGLPQRGRHVARKNHRLQ